MSDKWKDRIIRGGVIVVGTMGIIGAMAGLTGIMAWYPGVGRASVMILAAAACIGLACVIAITFPNLSRTGRGRCRRGDPRGAVAGSVPPAGSRNGLPHNPCPVRPSG